MLIYILLISFLVSFCSRDIGSTHNILSFCYPY